MTKIKSLIGVVAVLSLSILFFSACSQKDEVNAPNQQNYDSAIYSVIDNVDLQNGIEDATLDKDFSFNDKLLNYTFLNSGMSFTPGNPMMKGNRWLERFDFAKNIGRILRQLNLIDTQRTEVKGFLLTFHDSAKVQVVKFFDAIKPILDSANVQRRAIIQDMRAGNITRDEAKTKLDTLNIQTRNLIEANPISLQVKQTLCDYRTQLFLNIRSILDSDQATKWDTLVANLKSPC